MGNPVVRFEIGAADDQALARFYAELFGWATVYAGVGDVEATLGRAEGLGATREYGPKQVDDHTWTGLFRDPAGNPFGVYRHGPH
jgi:predicted enzyme related to lactoylglutathione lyase